MIRIAITNEAHEAIASTVKDGLIKLQETEDGFLWVWLPRPVAQALASLRRPGESYSDVIMRLANGK
ncbi:MAG TPA: hypothetical protein VGG68_14995 [Caulobacteraceae bacterium]|jgi:hypothetical protein